MKKMHVYSHTHWDYEWYFTASESIIQLIYHMDEVISALESGTLKTYLLDSQVSILEEYLHMMPEKEPVIRCITALIFAKLCSGEEFPMMYVNKENFTGTILMEVKCCAIISGTDTSMVEI